MKGSIIALISFFLITGFLGAQVIRKNVPDSSFESVTILYTANTQGLHAASQTDAPASAMKTIINALHEENKDSLLVDLGNFMGATPTTVLTQGKFDFQVMELLGYDLLHISSDEFSAGAMNLNSRIAETKIPVLSGNMNIPGKSGKKWIILQAGNRKVGFIGITSSNFMDLVMEKRRRGVTVEPVIKYISDSIKEMTGKADIVVALTDFSESEIAQIRGIPGLDLIITTGGDSAKAGVDWISVGFPGTQVAAVARTLESGTAVHVLDLHGYPDNNKWTIDEVVGAVYPVTKQSPRENAAEKYLQWTIDHHIRNNETIIGELKEPLPNIDEETQQTALGTTVADLMRRKTKSHLAVVRAGALETGLKQGPITEWDLIKALPYADDDLVVIKLTGAQIQALIAESQSNSGGSAYLHFSGYSIQPISLETRISGLPIEPGEYYTVTCSEFLAQGGGGYDELVKAKIVERIPLSAQDLVREGFKKDGTILVDRLAMDRETVFAYAHFRISTQIVGQIVDPSISELYPTEPSLIGQQLLSGNLDVRLDLIFEDYFAISKSFIELQYGLSFDREWEPSETIDSVQGYSEFSPKLSSLLFGGIKTLDPYISGDLQTVLLFPNPFNEDIDPTLSRPGYLRFAVGLELTLFKVISLKSGVRLQLNPFDETIPPTAGLEEILSIQAEIFPGILSFSSRTDLFVPFEIENQGLTIDSKNQILFSLQENIKLGPGVQLYYNSLVDHLAYVINVPLILSLTF